MKILIIFLLIVLYLAKFRINPYEGVLRLDGELVVLKEA